jgi:hypothetical protein
MIELPKMSFKGVPNQQDIDKYRNIYYDSVEKITYENYGQGATTENTIESLNLHGNWWFYDSFPDAFKTKEQLNESGREIYMESFKPLSNNAYATYVNALMHIRSKSERTPIGRLLVLPDQYYTINTHYGDFVRENQDTPLSGILLPIHNNYDYQKFIPDKWIQKTLFQYDTYKSSPDNHFIRVDLKEKSFNSPDISRNFLTNPANSFEKKFSENFVRAIFMDEKFKYYGSSQKSFIDTPVSTSSSEPASIVFTTEDEDYWVKRIHDAMLKEGSKGIKEIIISDRDKTYADKIAVKTSKKLSLYL